MITLDQTKTYAIDLSHNNTPFDWAKLNPLVKLIILKAGQGASFKDPMMAINLANARKLGLWVGFYFFWDSRYTAQQNIDNFMGCDIDWYAPKTLPPIFDIENQIGANDAEGADLDKHIFKNPTDSKAAVQLMLTQGAEKSGRNPIIYTYNGF